MKVAYNYLDKEFENTKKIFIEWKKLIKSTDFTLGKKMIEFEKKFSRYIGAKYCIATNNGTDALILCLKSIGIKEGDEVITVCNTFYATVGAIVACGAKPVFVDSDHRYQIDISKIHLKITRKTKAIIPVHWGGASPDMKKIIAIAKKYNIKVVEDACMGIGGKINKKSPGTFGVVNAFSMHPLKSLNVMGDGGVVATNNKTIYQWMLKFRNHGMINRDNINFWGVNMRMQPIQSVVALEGLKKINKVIKKRNINAKFLDNKLKILYPRIKLPKRIKNNLETFSLYMIMCENRDKLKKYLEKKGIEVKIHYPIPLHMQKASKIYKYKKGDFPNAENQAKKLLTIPVHQFLTKVQLNYVTKNILNFYKNGIN